ncbi:ArnT family glycosyltransferase [Chloroflexota bacterium]
MKEFLSHRWNILIALILAGLAVRVFFILHTGIFYDEGILLYKSLQLANGEILYVDIGDNRTPLVTVAISLLLRLPFLEGNLTTFYIIRFLFMILTLLMVPFIYAIGRDLYNRKVGLVAATFLVFEPLLLGQSIQVIPEVPSLCFVVIGAYFLIRAMTSNTASGLSFFWAGFFLALAFLSHPYAALPIMSFGLYFVGTKLYTRNPTQTYEERFLKPGAKIALGGLVPVIICVSALLGTHAWSGFLVGLGYSADISSVWEPALSYAMRWQYFEYTIKHASTIIIWVFGIGQAIYCFISFRQRSLFVSIWFSITVLSIFSLPQSPGYPLNYIWIIPPLSLLAANSLIDISTTSFTDIFFLGRLVSLRFLSLSANVAVSIVVICVSGLGFYSSQSEIKDPGNTITITTEPLSDQQMIASYIAEHTNASDKIVVTTTSYAFLSNRSAVNHFTFGPSTATRQQIEGAIANREAKYALIDPRTEYRMQFFYPSTPMESLKLLTWIKINNSEDHIADGVNILITDKKRNMLNHWIYTMNWDIPKSKGNMAHSGQQIEGNEWAQVQLNISERFLEYYGYYPEEVMITLAANANGGSNITFSLDDLLVYDNQSLLFYEAFDGEDSIHRLNVSGGEGQYRLIEEGYRTEHALAVSAINNNFMLQSRMISNGILGLIYRNYNLEKTFIIKKHLSSEGQVPVELWRIRDDTGATPAVYVRKEVAEIRNDDSSRETATHIYGMRQLKKMLEISPLEVPIASLNVLLQENGNAPLIRVTINGQPIGNISSRNLLEDPSNDYVWRELFFDSSLINEGQNIIIFSIADNSGSREADFWRLGIDNSSSGYSFYSPDGSKWFEREEELMIYLKIYQLDTLFN